jgi:hypothetical protein
MIQRHIALLGVLGPKNRVTVGKCAALAVLAAEADWNAVMDQGAVSEQLGMGPVEGTAVLDPLLTLGRGA